jgi:malonate-semialdehyde dehydrogenase (acetylating)/methylmalonate-semialdehyde dehydrogenase
MEKIRIPNEPLTCQNLVGGKFVTPKSPATCMVASPYTNDLIGKVAETSQDELDQAVGFAQEAFPSWRALPLKEKAGLLFRFRELVLANLDELTHVVAAESGKTYGEAKAGILKGVEVTEFAISLENSRGGEVMEVSRGVTCESRREPLGVVASIAPFNFPAMVPMWTYPIALMLGNCVILKPSEKVPLTSQKMGKLITQAGFPAGVFSLVNGGKDTVTRILDHQGIKAVSFVGSTAVAEQVYQRGTSRNKRVLALGGAKNFLIVTPDADVELTASGVVSSFTGCAGQRCMAGSIVVAVGDCETQIQGIKQRASEVAPGKNMGAIIDKAALERIKGAIAQAEKEGAKIILDGRKVSPPSDYSGGNWIGATLIDQVSPEMQCYRQEIFGPVLTIVRVKTLSEAMKLENEHSYGNATSVFTSQGAVANFVADQASCGMIGVNIGVPVPREPFSFGGRKNSKFGSGDITGASSLEFWSDLKKVTVKWSEQSDKTWMS